MYAFLSVPVAYSPLQAFTSQKVQRAVGLRLKPHLQALTTNSQEAKSATRQATTPPLQK